MTSSVGRAAIVGAGVIGASWAALFLAKGLKVVATDVAADAEASLRGFVDKAWPALERLGLAPGASPAHLAFTPDLAVAIDGADFVQESGPERIDLKQALYRRLDELAPANVIIASSSSGLMMSEIQKGCAAHPERCVIGHPFNPPHLIPLVEVVGGAKTSPETIERAMAFYRAIGKKPIHLHKEVVGHVANRLQAALWREVVHLIEEGVVDVADADAAVCWGPGLRWGVMGPNLIFHLGGGQGGMRHFLDHLSGPFAAWWRDLGTQTEFSPAATKALIDGAEKEAGDRSIDQLARQRDEALLGLLALRAKER
jgi:3-hydroxyacyl-CoA dehydrogenase